MPHRRAFFCSLRAAKESFSSVSRSQFLSDSAIASTFHIQIDVATRLEHIQAYQLRAAARPATACAALRRIQRAMSGAYQILTVRIEKLSLLPVEFHRYVRAAVDIGVHPAAMADGERGRGFAFPLEFEAHAVAGLGEFAAGTDQARAGLGLRCPDLGQAFFSSHGASSCGVSMQASGLNTVRLSLECAP